MINNKENKSSKLEKLKSKISNIRKTILEKIKENGLNTTKPILLGLAIILLSYAGIKEIEHGNIIQMEEQSEQVKEIVYSFNQLPIEEQEKYKQYLIINDKGEIGIKTRHVEGSNIPFPCAGINLTKEIGNIAKVEPTDIEITYINPPKHYSASGKIVDLENSKVEKLYSRKHCTMVAKVGDIIKGQKITLKDGDYTIKVQNKSQLCKGHKTS